MSDWSQALRPHAAGNAVAPPTISGNRGLDIEEKLIFEQDSPGHCGVDLPEPATAELRLGGVKPRARVGLPGLAEPTVMRHYTRLSRMNMAIDTALYPL